MAIKESPHRQRVAILTCITDYQSCAIYKGAKAWVLMAGQRACPWDHALVRNHSFYESRTYVGTKIAFDRHN